MKPDANHYGTFSVFELERQPLPTLMVKDFFCRQIKSDEAELMQQVMNKSGQYVPDHAATKLAEGCLGYIGQVHLPETDSLLPVAYGWVNLKGETLGPTGFAFHPPTTDVYLFDFATMPDYRGRSYYPALLIYILGELKAQGYKRAWIGTAPGNAVSARSIARTGFQLVGYSNIIPQPAGQPWKFETIVSPDISPEIAELAQASVVRVGKEEVEL